MKSNHSLTPVEPPLPDNGIDPVENLSDMLPEQNPAASAPRAAERQACGDAFSNYISVTIKNERGKDKPEKRPRHLNDMVADVHERFDNFPRVIGRSCLFDHTAETGIYEIQSPEQLVAWIDSKSGKNSLFTSGDGFRTPRHLFERLLHSGTVYQAISEVPNWPQRSDVFYAHAPLPAPSEGFQVFERFVNMFSPASPAYRTVLKAFIAAPLWYVAGIPRPGWIIDSEDGAGTGKTTIVELVAKLYGDVPVRTNSTELNKKSDELIKRLVSASGRKKRVALVDNVTGQFSCSALADMMTCEAISGKAPYGRGEESRLNDLVWALTSNSATVDNDIADRSYFIHVKRPEWSMSWRTDAIRYINDNRLQIIADIIGILETGQRREPRTRFPEFCSQILSPMCRTDEEYTAALGAIEEARTSANAEDEEAKTIEDEFESRLISAGLRPGTQRIFIRTEVIKYWMEDLFRGERIGHPAQFIRNLIKNGLTTRFNAKPILYGHRSEKRRRGIMWEPIEPESDAVHLVTLDGRNVREVF